MATGGPFDPRKRERRLGTDRRWAREEREPSRRYGPRDRRTFVRRERDIPVSRFRRVLQRWFWPNRGN